MSMYQPSLGDPDQCARCGAPKAAHGPAAQCDPDAVAYGDLLGHAAAKATGAVEAPREGKKTRIGVVLAVAGALITIGAGASSCINSGINYRQMRALEKLAERVEHGGASPTFIGTYNPESTLRRAPSGQVEVLIDHVWIPTKLWILPNGNVQIVVPMDATVPKDGSPFTEIAPMKVTP